MIFSLFCCSTSVVKLLNSFLVATSYLYNISIVVVANSSLDFLLVLEVFKFSSHKFCNHNFTGPISVLSIYPCVSLLLLFCYLLTVLIYILFIIGLFYLYLLHNLNLENCVIKLLV